MIANEDASRPHCSPPSGRYRMVRIENGAASDDAWIVEITVLTENPLDEDV